MKTRRSFLLALASSPVLARTDSPRNQLCIAANAFHVPYQDWAEKMNASRDKPLTIPADAIEAFDPLPQLWRRVEHLYRTWLRGY